MMTAAARRSFELRWDRYEYQILDALKILYPDQVDEVAARLRSIVRTHTGQRSMELRILDEKRLLQNDWLQLPEMLGYVFYADRFNGDLAGAARKVEYLRELGVRYVHVMPFLQPRPGENDGGYAVMDYRDVRDDLGTMDDLEDLAAILRDNGMSLEMDLVLNHVAKEHEWARKAREGEEKYRNYFHMFETRDMPDAYERTLPEIFPDWAPGNFTWDEAAGAWVWTTFNSYQWDLNWSNPDVLCEFVDLLCWLANKGVEVFRLDAIAFTWKRMGTTCQNEPEVHALTQAMRACMRVAAPAVAFKAEAIVAPEDLMAYLGQGEHYSLVSDMAYNNELMVQLWNCIATGDAKMASAALAHMPDKPPTTTWATYVRCHDDIGWAISDHDAGLVGVNGYDHRRFLSDFYSGSFGGSFARGYVFQENPTTGDRRISGSCASLSGLEVALENALEAEAAAKREAKLEAARAAEAKKAAKAGAKRGGKAGATTASENEGSKASGKAGAAAGKGARTARAKDDVLALEASSAMRSGSAVAAPAAKPEPVLAPEDLDTLMRGLGADSPLARPVDTPEIATALDRIMLIYSIIAGYGGIPLLYMGDELGLLNDRAWADVPEHSGDNRWAHRPMMDWELAEIAAEDSSTVAGALYSRMKHLFAVRAQTPHLHAAQPARVVASPDPRVMILERWHPTGRLVEVYNVSNQKVALHGAPLRERLGYSARELIGGHDYDLRHQSIDFGPYVAAWFLAN